MDFIEVEIVNWSKYNKRSEFKNPRWFALNNRLLEDPLFYEFTHEEIVAWIYVLCQASQKNSSIVQLFPKHALRVCSISKRALDSTLDKLKKAQAIQYHVRDLENDERQKGTAVRTTTATLHNITVHNNNKGDRIKFVHPTSLVEFKSLFTPEVMNSWFKTFNEDREWIESQLSLAYEYFYIKKIKAPSASVRGWVKRIDGWLARGWESHAKNKQQFRKPERDPLLDRLEF